LIATRRRIGMSEHDLSEFLEATAKHGPSCSIGTIAPGLADEQKEKLGAALAAEEIPATAIAKVVSRWSGQKVQPATIRRHRKGECACG
jgi:hypothetical protein